MTAMAEPVLKTYGIYGIKDKEVAQLIPATYHNTDELYRNETRKCLIQILVPDTETMNKVEGNVTNNRPCITKERYHRENRLTYEYYDVHIVLTNDYTASGMYKQFIRKADEYKTIAMILYGEMDVMVEEVLFDRFIRSGKLFAMLVTN